MKSTQLMLAASATGAVAWTLTYRGSPAVRSWNPSTLPISQTGRLSYRHGGPVDASSVLLLHGMVATGDVFGSTPDHIARCRRVIVPDLLGFGRSLDETRTDFSTEAHLDALDELIDRECPTGPLSIGAHSMGSAIALRVAARHADRVDRVVCVGAPTWPSPEEAKNSLGRLGAMSRALLFDEQLAHRICHFSCEHRTLAGVLSAAAAPRWPIPIARQASLHTWPAYIQTLTEQIVECPWTDLLRQLDERECPVVLVRGDDDPIGDESFARELATDFESVTLRLVPGDHTLPAAQPDLLDGELTKPCGPAHPRNLIE